MREEKKKRRVIKRNVKSSVFTHLFSIGRYRRELYISLNPQDKDIEDKEIKTYTLSSIFTNIQINDLGLLVRDKLLILVEAQSTWTVNILPRMIEYIGESFNRYIIDTNQNIYGTKQVVLPKPELYVLYTGSKVIRGGEISFKEKFFNDECDIDVRVKVITIKNSSKVVNEYIKFAKVVDENNKRYGWTKRSIETTIKYCIKNDILKEYLEEYKKEVYNIMTSVYNQKTATDMYMREQYIQGRAEGIEEGMERGRTEGGIFMIMDMYKKRLIDLSVATKMLHMTKEDFNKLLRKHTDKDVK